jgi:3-phenylpropionate/trans-cinnamate dioxygenase ferredoxin reductase subunit
VKLQIAGLAEGADDVIVRGDVGSGRSASLLYLKDSQLLAVDAINSPRDFVFGKKLIIDNALLDVSKLSNENLPLSEAVRT